MSSRVLPFVLSAAALGAPLAAAAADEYASQSQAIINGEACDETAYPETLAILFAADATASGRSFHIVSLACSATLIAPDVVLAAGHCADESLLRAMMAQQGLRLQHVDFYVTHQADLSRYSSEMMTVLPEGAQKVSSVRVHPDFNWNAQMSGGPQKFDDISVLFLETPQDLQPAVVITAEESSQLVVDAPVSIVGWGQRSATRQIAGLKQCGETTINELGATEMQIGAGSSTTRKCHGDSGGPSFLEVETASTIKRRIVGVTSHGYDQTDCAKGGLDTRVDQYLPWLEETLATACDEGARSWCEVKGVIPPSFYDPKPKPKEDPGSAGDEPGCAAAPVSIFALLPLVAGMRRRKNEVG